MPDWRIPLFDVSFGAEDEAAVLRPVRAGWLTMGEEVLRLEEDLCRHTGAKHAIAVSSGTAALHLACLGLGLGPGDEVLCPTLTFVACANTPRAVGASVRFCESCGPQDLTVDPASLRERATGRTRAIMAVHYAGFPCRMEEILEFARERNAFVIEDCAHALFTTYRGRTLGRWGQVGCFSFYSNKNITCGEGGALITDDDALAERLRRLRSHGMTVPTLDRHKGRAFSYEVEQPGLNYRLDEIRAALLRAQLGKLPRLLARRREIFALYAELLAGSPVLLAFAGGVRPDLVIGATGRNPSPYPLPKGARGNKGLFLPVALSDVGVHIVVVLLPEGADREAVVERMKRAGIQTSLHYPLIHLFAAYREPRQSLPRTEALAPRLLTLPLYPAMTDADVRLVVATLLSSLG
jgi:dTDP-4-amino-4,6-dideoxygalactose transaminase